MENAYLLSMELNGIKNISQPVKLSFYKKTVDKNFDPQRYRVKAIYGGNGTGKSGLITAVDILKRIVLDRKYLSDKRNQIFLRSIVNKKTKRLDLNCEILTVFSGDYYVVRYEVTLKENYTSEYEISYEKMSYKKSNYQNDKFNILYLIEDGMLTNMPWTAYIEDYKTKAMNLLNDQSFISIIKDIIINNEIGFEADMALFVKFIMFAFNTYAYLQNDDKHENYKLNEFAKVIRDNDDTREVISIMSDYHKIMNINERVILKKEYKDYEKYVQSLTEYLKIFKKDLLDVEIDKKEDEDYFICNLILKYKDYDIDEEFESSGIKKLISMFDYLSHSSNGSVVFIDEMDANINDVYFCKLIEYFMYYGKGQLVFTTHNLDPMAILKENKMSIDFLSSINTIHTWKKNGNFAPDNLYRNGMIEDIPFNVDSTDFVGVFEED